MTQDELKEWVSYYPDTGVHQIKKTGRFRACCNVNGKKHHLGVFATEEEAASVYQQFKQQYLPK